MRSEKRQMIITSSFIAGEKSTKEFLTIINVHIIFYYLPLHEGKVWYVTSAEQVGNEFTSIKFLIGVAVHVFDWTVRFQRL